MATIPLTIDNVTYNYPGPGEDPGWGEDASGWAEGVTDVLNTLLGPGTIVETTINLNNNQTTSEDVNGLIFDISTVRSAIITYSIYRTSTDTPTGTVETGQLHIVYDNLATDWLMSQERTGDAGVTFEIDSLGQVSYTSTNIDSGSGGYSGTMKFTAATISQ